MFEIAIMVLALAVLTFLVLRTVLRGTMRQERPPQRISKPGQTSAPLDPYGGIAVPGSPVAEGLDAIMAADRHFEVRHFITGAKSAYETVVTAYADGDRRTLTTLLAPEVYEGFEAVIRERKDHGETAETRGHVRNPVNSRGEMSGECRCPWPTRSKGSPPGLAQPGNLQGLQIARRHDGHGQYNRRSQD